MKKYIFLALVSLLSFKITSAQQNQASISFEKEVHDFGKIKEDGGKVEYRFIFTNTGQTPLIITKVQASCGCTSPSWTENPVMPGQKGFVNAIFDPQNRPGNFNKSITVESNAINSRVVLRIQGEVLAREKTINDIYPRAVGELRLQTNHFSFVTVYTDQVKVDTFKVFNSSKNQLKIGFSNVPAYIKLKPFPTILKPGEQGYILGEYDGTNVNDWDFVTDRVKILINDTEVENNTITISAKVQQNFSKLSPEQIKNAPKIEFDSPNHNFGKVKSSGKYEHTFTFKNSGNSELVIHKIKSTCGCTTVNPEKTILKPGESSTFKAIFNTSGMKGKQNKSIYVVTNDPNNSNIRLMISAEIEG
ncbi:MAG: hypothetical protein A2W99_15685 [Bacteroidetes bacterium GWF2_33_16]|nr:MAG: hypothetical protein A2X00_15030 [Bacteroidetes bacterium GWE2_32_14]OFY02349.1 MAG: hypothetical protein A2W99_15685 [Bacteroidetes bacterium GWF2_33_16]